MKAPRTADAAASPLATVPDMGILGSSGAGLLLLALVALPVWNLVVLLQRHPRSRETVEILTVVGTVVFGGPALVLLSVGAPPWHEPLVLYGTALDGMHEAFARGSVALLLVPAAVAVAGYVVLRTGSVLDRPPLLVVLALAAVHVGALLALAVLVQVVAAPEQTGTMGLYTGVVSWAALNVLLLQARVVRDVVQVCAERAADRTGPAPEGRSLRARCERLLRRTARLPQLGLVAALPLLVVVCTVMVLLGQSPEAPVRAFTDTADWAFSRQVPPPPVDGGDAHYLCTVAAAGSPALVRPLRVGERRGRPVLVNRQLCVANAFEDLLAERAPRVHRVVRGAYDRWGYPLSRHVATQRSADVTYRLMKPLEWAFVVVLYVGDRDPERRIDRQYRPEGERHDGVVAPRR